MEIIRKMCFNQRKPLPFPVVKVDVDLDSLVNQARLQQEGLGLVGVPTEQQHVSQPGLLGGQILDGIDVLHFVNLLGGRAARKLMNQLGFAPI